ncbi:hypothetical protein G7B40_003035 [Aetokthonos hydrillicola Thurmond2011]|uniref:Uncharacterized protein n=1 Tax=Aetokthonos hydrillicola Thurmond2011 TaxID=2712845 RepID=A0AAP5I2M1_9CYAN|nr:hypothetical protein [Aetokthonos hydrillicola]MBO3459350.1 hypothetical protein [Aetokthonos hydrillicola CCALA 1050]MBW4586496.1 hypothetical protein [Aetokthonos hydrillicola CCALA 1050]MDR9893560.1 hypothetical protein [Aetokthonos hydrillicola Thurmond2011]
MFPKKLLCQQIIGSKIYATKSAKGEILSLNKVIIFRLTLPFPLSKPGFSYTLMKLYSDCYFVEIIVRTQHYRTVNHVVHLPKKRARRAKESALILQSKLIVIIQKLLNRLVE